MTKNPPSPDDITLQTYEAAAERYRDHERHQPPPRPVVDLMDRVAALVGAGAECLELGSGSGRDALALEERGLRVTRTDATAAFLEMLRADGHTARRLDIRTDDFGGPFHLVWANAVLLHLTRTEFAAALRKAHAAVRPSGVLAMTLKEGAGEEWHNRKLDLPRHFTYWREPQLRDELTAAGWQVIALEHVAGEIDRWLHVIGRAA